MQTSQGRYIRFGKRGSSDFLIFLNGGRTIHLEVKNEKGRQTTTQLEYEIKVKQLGHQYNVVRSVDEVQTLLKNLEIMKPYKLK